MQMPDYAILRDGGQPQAITPGNPDEYNGYAFAATQAEALGIAGELAHLGSGGPVIVSPEQLDDLRKGSWAPVPSAFVTALSYVTDKVRQGYMGVYERIAAELGPAASVCEIGVWFGGSLATWQALFPDGIVAGADCDPESRWPDGTVRIVCGQDDEALPGLLMDASPGGYGLIVDDASHDGKLTRRTWELLWPLVQPGGYYVVEDWFVGLGKHPWEGWGDSMLKAMESLLPLLDDQDCDPDSIEFRYGMAILHRKRAPEGADAPRASS